MGRVAQTMTSLALATGLAGAMPTAFATDAPATGATPARAASAVSGSATQSIAGGVLSDAKELRKYEAGHIVRAIYHADATALRGDVVFTRKYLIAQAAHLGENCDTFKVSEIRGYESALQRQVMAAAQQNMGQLMRESLNLMVQAQRDMTSLVAAGDAQQRLEDAPGFGISDVERLAKSYGACDAPVIARYTTNLRTFLDRAR